MKMFTVVGARPQFIKAAPVSKALRQMGACEYLLHTGQHYDYGMSEVFFQELDLPEPAINLGIGSGSHGRQTGEMLYGIEQHLIEQKPDWILVYGDTNSTLAGALAAAKLHIPIAHIEAGLRSYNRMMPEEHNRVLTDHCSDLLFCPTRVSVENLKKEGIIKSVYLVGDVMYDAVLQFGTLAQQRSTILKRLGLNYRGYLLATVHRAANTDDLNTLAIILEIFRNLEEVVVLPIHPRTQSRLENSCLAKYLHDTGSRLKFIEPVGYLDMLVLEKHARAILTDSGGVQKEAYFHAVPCVTLRTETEWVEIVENGWNVVTGLDKDSICAALTRKLPKEPPKALFGKGNASVLIAEILSGKRPIL